MSNVASLVPKLLLLGVVSQSAYAARLKQEARNITASTASDPSENEVMLVRKPGKAMRDVTRRIKYKDDKAKHGFKIGDMKCGDTLRVTSADEKDVRCPLECPLFAQDKTDDDFCTFTCVKDREGCLQHNPDTPIADLNMGICRTAMVQNCKVFAMDGTDSCKVCGRGFYLGLEGKCHSEFRYLFYALGVFFLLLLVVIVFWLANMVMRPIYNGEVLLRSLEFRSHQKLRKTASSEEGGDERGNRELWPVFTNMIREAPAGAGMMLHFNFQAVVIVWGLCIGLGWVVLAAVVDKALFVLGTRKYGSPRENCILVAWGYETQQRLMWTKVLFLACTYTFTFVGSIWFAIRQLKIFQDFDYKNKTMKDFVAIMKGVQGLRGDRRVETELKDFITSATGVPVVGVSVAWNFKEHEEDFMAYLQKDMVTRDPVLKRHNTTDAAHVPKPEHMGVVTSFLYDFERSSLASEGQEEEVLTAEQVKEKLTELETSHTAFVVFESEASRDKAIEQLQEAGGLEFEGNKVTLESLLNEPDTVQWVNFGNASLPEQLSRLFIGFGAIFLALLFWSVVFYAPYAWAVMSFNYANGQQPGFIYGFSFSMVVCIGNQIMYEVCARVSEYVGYRFSDTKAVCYMMLFTVACLWNVCVDMVTTYYVAEQIMMELGFRTYHGLTLKEVPTFTERFETYAMQRTLAENTFGYAFPSTFLVPFLLEPFATVLVPLMLGVYIVGSHPEIRGREAEEWVAAIPIDLGRYADILLNMVLAILIFYFPGGYTHTLFIALGLSHVYIYAMDQYKVLRSVPSITVATMEVDWWAQALLAPCCGLILSCLVFKANCQDFGYCIEGPPLVLSCTSAFIAHCILHVAVQTYVVPIFGKPPPDEADDPCAQVTFKDIAQANPQSWFTTNPVHCLRSQHVYDHQPPCRFLFSGKEHLLEANPSIGCFYRGGKVATSEHFDRMRSDLTAVMEKLSAEDDAAQA